MRHGACRRIKLLCNFSLFALSSIIYKQLAEFLHLFLVGTHRGSLPWTRNHPLVVLSIPRFTGVAIGNVNYCALHVINQVSWSRMSLDSDMLRRLAAHNIKVPLAGETAEARIENANLSRLLEPRSPHSCAHQSNLPRLDKPRLVPRARETRTGLTCV